MRFIGSPGTGAGQFVEPRAIAAAPDGRIFVVDKTGRVQRFGPSGEIEHLWGMPDNADDVGKPSGICVDAAGRVFVADTHRHRVVVFDRDGGELFRFGEHGMGPGQFLLPTDVAVDSEGFIYVSEYGGNDRVSKFDSTGNHLFSFGDLTAGVGALQRPSGLAVDADYYLWVADTGNHRVCCFAPNGDFLKSVGSLGREPGELRYPRDIAFTADAILTVMDCGNNRLSRFRLDGGFLGCWGHAGWGSTGLHTPTNVTALKWRLFIADSKNHRIACLPREVVQGEWEQLVCAAVGRPRMEDEP